MSHGLAILTQSVCQFTLGVYYTGISCLLFQYIQDFYHEDPEIYNQEIAQLEALRASAVRPGRDVSGVANMKRYYCQLHFLRSRFPMVRDGLASVQFNW